MTASEAVADPAEKFWQHLARSLAGGMDTLFVGVPGDEPNLLDAAVQLEFKVQAHRDQRLAAFSAIGWGRSQNSPGVLSLDAGPGYLNALTGISEASSIGQPLIVVCMAAEEDGVARGGFQEMDVARIGESFYRWTFHARTRADVEWAARYARSKCQGANPGPVLLVLSRGLWLQDDPAQTNDPFPRLPRVADASGIDSALDLINASRRIVLVLGGGTAGVERETVVDLVNRLNAVVLCTASGRGVFPESDPRFGGLIGLYQTEAVPVLMRSAQLVIVIGSRLEETARTGWSLGDETKLIRVDNDPSMFMRPTIATLDVHADAESAMLAFGAGADAAAEDPEWQLETIDFIPDEPAGSNGITAPEVWREIEKAIASPQPMVLCQENGLADLWGYYLPTFRLPDNAIPVTPGEQTAMGFGFGAALGAAASGAKVVAVGGDGAIEANISALLIAAESRLDVCFIVLRNGLLGWPSLSRSDGDPMVSLESGRDLVAFAESMGLSGERIESHADLADRLKEIVAGRGPTLIEVTIRGRDAIPFAH